MKVSVSFRSDGLLEVVAGSDRYTALEAHFRTEGQMPVMDLSIPLGELEPIEAETNQLRSLDDPPA